MNKTKVIWRAGVLAILLGGVLILVVSALKAPRSERPPRLASAASDALKQKSTDPSLPSLVQAAGTVEEAPAAAATFIAQPAACVVNGAPITRREVEEELDRILISAATHGKMSPTKREDLRKTVLDELIVRELAYQKARAVGLKVGSKETAESVQSIKQRYHSEKSFHQALVAEQISYKDFERRVERDLLLKRIHQTEIEDRSRVADQEVENYYQENKEKFVKPESLHLHGIAVKAPPGKEAEAQLKIEEAAQKLKSGEAFDAVAYKFSEDDYRVLGGDYGTIHRGQLDPALEKAAFGVPANQLTAPTRTSYGWYILKVEDKQPQRQLDFAEVREKIKNSLYRKRLTQNRLDFIRRLRSNAKIEYFDKTLAAVH